MYMCKTLIEHTLNSGGTFIYIHMRGSTVVFILNVETIRLTPKESSIVGPYQRPYTITCRGENIRTWQWIHNNAIVRNSSDGRVQVWSRGRIHFTSLRYEDIGVYYCKTGNFFQYDVFGTYRLTVNGMYIIIIVSVYTSVYVRMYLCLNAC